MVFVELLELFVQNVGGVGYYKKLSLILLSEMKKGNQEEDQQQQQYVSAEQDIDQSKANVGNDEGEVSTSLSKYPHTPDILSHFVTTSIDILVERGGVGEFNRG